MPVWTDKCYRLRVMPLNKILSLFLFVFSGSLWAATDKQILPEFKALPYSAEYYAYRSGAKLGKAEQNLSKLENNTYQLFYQSKLSLLFLSDKRKETSRFLMQDGVITPISYRYSRTGTGSDKKLDVEFDGQNKLIKISPDKTLPWNNELDNQLYSLDVRKKLSKGDTQTQYQMINSRGQQRQYGIQVLGNESLELPYGTLETIKTKIIRSSKKRETFIWFAPQLDYVMVRLQQFKEGKEQGDIKLSRYQVNSPQAAAPAD